MIAENQSDAFFAFVDFPVNKDYFDHYCLVTIVFINRAASKEYLFHLTLLRRSLLKELFQSYQLTFSICQDNDDV